MNVTNYSQDELKKLHLDTFKRIAGEYIKGHCTGKTWSIRVGVGTVSLVTPYSVKQDDGSWIDKEHTMVL